MLQIVAVDGFGVADAGVPPAGAAEAFEDAHFVGEGVLVSGVVGHRGPFVSGQRVALHIAG